MAEDKATPDGRSNPERRPPDIGSASFGRNQPGSLSVNVETQTLNIHPSNLSALERIAEKNPEIASQLIKATEKAVAADAKKYGIAAMSAAAVALAIIIGSAAVIVSSGVVAGLIFFMACVAACAVVTAVFTGKAQDISWTVRLLGRNIPPDEK